MNFLNVGSQSRKTGIFARSGTRKDANNLEDLDDFFERNGTQQDSPSGVSASGSNSAAKRKSRKQSTASPIRKSKKDAHVYGTPKRRSNVTTAKRAARSSLVSPNVELSDSESNNGTGHRRGHGRTNGQINEHEDEDEQDNNFSDMDEVNVSPPRTPIHDAHDDNDDDDIDIDNLSAERLSPIGIQSTKANTKSASSSQSRAKESKPKVAKSKTSAKAAPMTTILSKATSRAATASPKQKASPVKKRTNAKTTAKKPASQAKSARATKNMALNNKKKTVPLTRAEAATTASDQESQGIRRSSRLRVPPLAFWKNEKVVYDYSNNTHVPSIKDVITVEPDDEPKPKRKPQPRKKKTPATNQQSQQHDSEQLPGNNGDVQYVYPNDELKQDISTKEYPTAKWMSDGSMNIKVFEGPGSKAKVNRTVAWAANKEVYSQVISSKKDNFKLAILFSEEQEFAASGMLEFPVDGIKHLKNTDDTYFIFYVITGILNVTISGNEFTVKSGCSFEIPMGNFYQFENKGKHPAKLFFVQSKYVVIDDDEEEGGEGEQEEEE